MYMIEKSCSIPFNINNSMELINMTSKIFFFEFIGFQDYFIHFELILS